MIPFEELSAALDRWRIRNGLPVVSADLPIIPDAQRSATAPSPFVMPASAPATQPRSAPPGASGDRPPTDSDILSIGDGDVMEDDEYANEGGDFAMNFGESGPAVPAQPAQEMYADDPYEGAEQTYAAPDAAYGAPDGGGFQDPAYDSPQELDADEPELAAEPPAEPPAEPLADDDEGEEDWSKMPNFPGAGDGNDDDR